MNGYLASCAPATCSIPLWPGGGGRLARRPCTHKSRACQTRQQQSSTSPCPTPLRRRHRTRVQSGAASGRRGSVGQVEPVSKLVNEYNPDRHCPQAVWKARTVRSARNRACGQALRARHTPCTWGSACCLCCHALQQVPNRCPRRLRLPECWGSRDAPGDSWCCSRLYISHTSCPSDGCNIYAYTRFP